MKRIAALAACLFLGTVVRAQDGEKRTVVADFEGDLGEWSGMALSDGGVQPDGDSKIAVTKDAGAAKVGKGALSYSYEIAPKTIRVLTLQKPMDLTGMKSMRFWVKCSHTTAVVIGLNETGGASYQAVAHCPANVWQEVTMNLDEFTLDDPAKDGNGKLDLDQVGAITIFDIGGFVAMFLPHVKGARTMLLDDIAFSSKPIAQTTGAAQVTRVVPIHLVDTFESPVIRWIPLSLEISDTPKFNLFDAAVAIDKDVPEGGGKGSLKFSYPRKGHKFHGMLRSVEKVDLSRAAALELALKSSHDGTYVVTIEEKDGSRYTRKVDLLLGDWKSFSWKLGDFTLAEDSQDENGKLDPDQIKQISLVDITTMAGGGEADENHLWLDQVVFILNP